MIDHANSRYEDQYPYMAMSEIHCGPKDVDEGIVMVRLPRVAIEAALYCSAPVIVRTLQGVEIPTGSNIRGDRATINTRFQAAPGYNQILKSRLPVDRHMLSFDLPRPPLIRRVMPRNRHKLPDTVLVTIDTLNPDYYM